MPVEPQSLEQVDPGAHRGAIVRTTLHLLGTRPVLWFERTLIWRTLWWRFVPLAWRLTGGRIGGRAPLPAGLLETRDARNGRPHRRVLFYFHDDEKVTVIATAGGLDRVPHWYANSLASPEVTFSGRRFRAEPVSAGAERERLWVLANRHFPPFAAYRARAARDGREIPILQLKQS